MYDTNIPFCDLLTVGALPGEDPLSYDYLTFKCMAQPSPDVACFAPLGWALMANDDWLRLRVNSPMGRQFIRRYLECDWQRKEGDILARQQEREDGVYLWLRRIPPYAS